MKPVLFCDVDGVINISKTVNDSIIETPFKHLDGLPKFFNYKTFRHRPQVADFIKNVEADFVWLTAWQKFAPISLDRMFGRESQGYLPWKHNLWRAFLDRKHFQKSVALNAWALANPGKPFIWIDDVATIFAEKYTFADREDVLIIKTETETGLTDEHINSVNRFISLTS